MRSDWASFHHVPICDPIPVTTWMQGSDRSDLEWRVLIGPASITCSSVTQALRPRGCGALLVRPAARPTLTRGQRPGERWITSRTSRAVRGREEGCGADCHLPAPVPWREPRVPGGIGTLSCGDRQLLLPGR